MSKGRPLKKFKRGKIDTWLGQWNKTQSQPCRIFRRSTEPNLPDNTTISMYKYICCSSCLISGRVNTVASLKYKYLMSKLRVVIFMLVICSLFVGDTEGNDIGYAAVQKGNGAVCSPSNPKGCQQNPSNEYNRGCTDANRCRNP